MQNSYYYSKILLLTLKALITTAADDNFLLFFFLFFRENKSWHVMWIVCLADDSSAWQTIHMKFQDLFSLKNKKNLECHLLQILLGALRIKTTFDTTYT